MRGGHGGLMDAQLAPISLDVNVFRILDKTLLVGGALRVELEGDKAVAGIARVALRHMMGSLEIRPGVGLPFYFAPRTMLGPEVSLGVRFGLSKDLAFMLQLSAAAFMVGNDVPPGNTVTMFQLFIGLELLT
jgi:hypothetical protein